MSECGNCGHWQASRDMPTVGRCALTGEYTGIGASCALHEGAGRVKAEKSAKSENSAKPFDIPAAADRVMRAYADGLISCVSITRAHAILKCQYRQAAEVVQYLVDKGAIKRNG